MKSLRMIIPGLLGGALLVPTVVQAGILAGDPNAMAGFKGNQAFTASIGPISYHATVDFAVYAPGAFNATFGAGADPSNGGHFVYAYQMYNTGSTAEQRPDYLSVGFNGDQSPASIGALPNAFGDFGIDPTTSTFVPGGPPYSSATWSRTTWLPSGTAGEVVLYTSPNAPGYWDASVKAGALVNQQLLPSPIPEPGTLAAAAGLVFTVLSARRRRD